MIYKTTDLAAALVVSQSTIVNWVKLGILKHSTSDTGKGNHFRFSEDDMAYAKNYMSDLQRRRVSLNTPYRERKNSWNIYDFKRNKKKAGGERT